MSKPDVWVAFDFNVDWEKGGKNRKESKNILSCIQRVHTLHTRSVALHTSCRGDRAEPCPLFCPMGYHSYWSLFAARPTEPLCHSIIEVLIKILLEVAASVYYLPAGLIATVVLPTSPIKNWYQVSQKPTEGVNKRPCKVVSLLRAAAGNLPFTLFQRGHSVVTDL